MALALHKVFLLMIQNLWDNMEAPSLNLLLLMSSLALDQRFFFQRSPHIFNSCLFPSEWFWSFSIFAFVLALGNLCRSLASLPCKVYSALWLSENLRAPVLENVPGETREGGLFDGFVSLPLKGDDNVSNKDPQIPFLTLVTLKGPHFSHRPFVVPVTKAELRIQWVSTSLSDRLTEWLASPCHSFLALG